ncbi:peptidoglycan-binding domain-containing protein [Archangium lansingense]|uniref:Peptidoglycan-binding domain-containing protein n=1 Tax=Archangium lansingense TaxID=2995310 RepID=A0ABT3ZYQ3_9BACT|nr:peptidoglycan-binding domain-containing protein [Archangium lansinium]MCY1073807.1 peptidoglycan-binding domain-containing protein [Archangium lansinium]
MRARWNWREPSEGELDLENLDVEVKGPKAGFSCASSGRWIRKGSTLIVLGVERVPTGAMRGELPQQEVFETSQPTLRLGSTGEAVMELQRRLQQAGVPPGPINGTFGPMTDSAVRAFQRSRQLAVDGIVGPNTWGELLSSTPDVPVPWMPPTSSSGGIHAGRGWGGSEGVADAAKAIARDLGIPVTSEKRNLEDTRRVGSTTGSDHYTGNTNAFATDFGVTGQRGDQLAGAIAKKYGIPASNIGTPDRHIINVDGKKYSLQLLWNVKGHYNHVHLGIRRVD